jgi:hypothetical protein
MKRGRKSASELSVVTGIQSARPAAPDDLTQEQAEVWRSVVTRLPANWFPRETFDVLAAYCRHVATHRFLTAEIDRTEPDWLKAEGGIERLGKLTAMRDRETKAMIAAARSLRITKSSQTRAEGAARGAASNPQGHPKPWDPNTGTKG